MTKAGLLELISRILIKYCPLTPMATRFNPPTSSMVNISEAHPGWITCPDNFRHKIISAKKKEKLAKTNPIKVNPRIIKPEFPMSKSEN